MILLMALGFVLLYLTEIFYFFRLIQMEWIAAVILIIPTVAMMIRLGTSKTFYQFEKVPRGKEFCVFLRRDGTCQPLLAKRVYFGESFLEADKIGLFHDLGKDSVYRWGDKNVRFILENVNHTPDPRFANFTSWLYRQGFNNILEVKKALDGGENIDVVRRIPEYVPVETKALDRIEHASEDHIREILDELEGDVKRKP